jgi:hypothetical protein
MTRRWRRCVEQRLDERITRPLRPLRAAADGEDALGKHPVTPGALVPAREQLGELLLRLKQPRQALSAYEAALKIYPARFSGLYGAAMAADQLGDRKQAKKYFAMLVKQSERADSMRPELAHARAYVGQPDPQHDFDFHVGAWKTHVKRRKDPLTDHGTWVEYDGTTVVRKVWDGRANLVELEADGPAGHLELLSLRLYEPETGKWSLNVASSRGGGMSTPAIGEFKNGRGEFFSNETLDGKPIVVRFVISGITPASAQFEQAFSANGGKTWEVNWIATDTRVE